MGRKKKLCLTAQMLMAQWNTTPTVVSTLPNTLETHLAQYKQVRPVMCLQKKGKHQALHRWSTEVQSNICLWCNPTLATGQGKLVLSWLQPERRAVIEDLLAHGETIPGPWEKGD